MEFTIKQSVLKQAIDAVRGSLEGGKVQPILSFFLIETLGENAIRMMGTDLDITTRRMAEAEIKTPGKCCIHARKLADIVNGLSDGDLHFATDTNGWMKMTAGKSKVRFATIKTDDYPAFPAQKSTPIKLQSADLIEIIQAVAFAMTKRTSRYNIQGTKLEIKDGRARAVATDGYALAIRDKQIDDTDAAFDALIPMKAVTEIVKMGDTAMSIGDDSAHLFFETADQIIAVRKMFGNFPRYELIIPKGNDRLAKIPAKVLTTAVKRCAVMSESIGTSGDKIRCSFGENALTITSAHREEGDVEDVLDIEHSGETCEAIFQWPFFLPFLNSVKNDCTLVAHFKDGRSQFEFNIDGLDGYQVIIMPANF